MNKLKYAVIGAGCGGQAIAGYLASGNFDVTLYNRSIGRIGPLIKRKMIRLKGALKGRGGLSYVGTDLSMALENRDIIMVVTTADGHKEIAGKMAPYLKNGQMIILNPGRTFGALEVHCAIREKGFSGNIIVAEANTLVYATRVHTSGTAVIKGVKKEVSIAALRADNTGSVLSKIRSAFPQFTAARSILETSFGNIGAVFHPVIILFNRDRIRNGKVFDFYIDGVTKKIAAVIEKVDNEMRQVAKALGAVPLSVTEWLASRYGLRGTDIYSMIRSNPTYQGIESPATLDHRYLWEDIPTGLVPVSSFGRALNIRTEMIDYLIDLGSELLGRDFRGQGRTVGTLGLSKQGLREELENIIFSRKIEAA